MRVELPDQNSVEESHSYRDDTSLLNRILYSMCESNPYHKNKEDIISKIQLIGRAYSASLDRRRDDSITTDDLYPLVACSLMNSDVDNQIQILHNKNLSCISANDEETIKQVLHLHKYFVSILEDYVKMNKRSLASKYLHFHLPKLFFLYDSRAKEKLKAHVLGFKSHKLDAAFDWEYATFFRKMIIFRDEIHLNYKIQLSPRQLDKLFLKY